MIMARQARKKNARDKTPAPADPHPDPVEKLRGMVGVEEVVDWVKDLQLEAEERSARLRDGKPVAPRLPFSVAIEGNPGTGKTTVAELLGEVLADLGMLPCRKITKYTASDLIGQYVGQSGPKTKGQCEKALGGLMIIDEAYGLGIAEDRRNDAMADFKVESFAEIFIYMMSECCRDKIAFAFLGYPGTRESLCNVNQGFGPRITRWIRLRDLTNWELCAVMGSLATKSGETFADGADVAMWCRFEERRNRLGKQFDNGRAARNLLLAAQMRRDRRLARTRGEDRSILREEVLGAELGE
jgi:hypothetical protein